MTRKKIYLVRHGQTDYNKTGIVQGGRIDAPINETGKAQADAFFEAYKSIPFDKIYTSELQRSWQSVQSFIDLGIPYEEYDGFNEISWGQYDGTALFENKHYWDVVQAWKDGDTNVTTDEELGESPEQLAAKQKEVMKLIFCREEEETILICMHGRAMRILLCHLMGESISNMDNYDHHNLGFYLLRSENGGITIERNNVIDHLESHGLVDLP